MLIVNSETYSEKHILLACTCDIMTYGERTVVIRLILSAWNIAGLMTTPTTQPKHHTPPVLYPLYVESQQTGY